MARRREESPGVARRSSTLGRVGWVDHSDRAVRAFRGFLGVMEMAIGRGGNFCYVLGPLVGAQ